MSSDHPLEAERLIANTIDAAEVIRDPLEGLAEKTVADPGAAFAPEVLERLAALKQEDRAGFEALRSQLKKGRMRRRSTQSIAEENGEAGGRGPTQADILIDLAQRAELFHAPDGTGFADLDIEDHRETWPIRAKGFRRWLARGYFEATQGAPSSEALQSALNVIEAKAHFDAPERTVHIRVGGLDGRLYLDLCDATWRAVEIDAAGWRVIDNPPVRFRCAAGMQVFCRCRCAVVRSRCCAVPERKIHRRVRARGRLRARVLAQSRSLSGYRARRAVIRQVHLLSDTAIAARPQRRALAGLAARGARSVHRRQQWPPPGFRQCARPAGVDFGHARLAGDRRLRRAPVSTPTRTRCCSTPPGL